MKREIVKVILSIVLFMIVYLVLVSAAAVLAVVFCWLGIMLMMQWTNFLGLLFGLGMIAAGISVFIFLVKFIFAVTRDENSLRMEVTEEQQPRLFAFIRELTTATGTKFPKKIYFSPAVNAAVFYNSSFWSMFLPIRKNLEIGLGLVNSVNVSEFKAVMAHEFGHFSQRSMQLGSFTYNVNRVIHNMLYENKGYSTFLNAWGKLHWITSLFAKLTAKIAQGIQHVLRTMYSLINKSYMGLSREMEFQADAIAAGISGGNNLVSALSRVEVAGSCYNTALSEANARVKQNKVSRNIFSNQLTIFRSVAEEYDLSLTHGLPDITYHFVTSFSRSRINFQNQWASHPTLAERKAHLDRLGLELPADKTSAWSLFEEPLALQEKATTSLYQTVKFDGPIEFYDDRQFEEQYLGRKNEYALPAEYRGYYEGRYIETKDWDLEKALQEPYTPKRFEDIFNEETGQLQAAINSNKKDAELAKAIREKKIDVKTFDFDGVKYDAKDGEKVASLLEKEIETQIQRQRILDKEAFLYFVHRPGPQGERILSNYRQWKRYHALYDEYVGTVNRVLQKIRPFYAGGLGLEEVNGILKSLKDKEEKDLKRKYSELEATGILLTDENKDLYTRVQAFLSRDYAYFIDKSFQNQELDELKGLAIDVANAFNRYQFKLYKKMLVEQLETAAETV
ncbi:MAG TPA: M48 family metallopeptidase [Puia sp.]|nr:M48 family metallopeptidase [Puia sp.]